MQMEKSQPLVNSICRLGGGGGGVGVGGGDSDQQ